MARFSREEGLFKIKPTKGIINSPDPERSDFLDCEQVKAISLEELTYLKSVLPIGSLASFRVGCEIKIRTYDDFSSSNIKNIAFDLDRIHKGRISITNVDIDKIEGREKAQH